METIDSDKISQKSRKSKSDRNGSIANNRISPRGSQITLDSNRRMSEISEKVICRSHAY